MQTCPKCKQIIEDDSWFCDQCGTELMVCPQCKAVRRGIRCNVCGNKLVPAKDFAQGKGVLGSSTTPPVANGPIPPSGPQSPRPVNPAPQPVGPSQQPQTPINSPVTPTNGGQGIPMGGDGSTIRPGGPQPQPARVSLPRPDHLVCHTPHIRLGVGNGAVIGRRGDYAQVFAGQGYVSGSHARLQFNASGELELVDLGSTNGTFVNGIQLAPNVPKVICIGDSIKFANLEFKAEP